MSAAAYITISCDHEGCNRSLQIKTGSPQDARAELKKRGWVCRKFPLRVDQPRGFNSRGRLPALSSRSKGRMRDLCPEHTSDKPEASK